VMTSHQPSRSRASFLWTRVRNGEASTRELKRWRAKRHLQPRKRSGTRFLRTSTAMRRRSWLRLKRRETSIRSLLLPSVYSLPTSTSCMGRSSA
jgi:hypothetical protein